MHRIHTRHVILLLAGLALGACGDSETEARPSGTAEIGAAGSGAAPASPAASDGSTDRFEVTLDSPPFEGTHQFAGDMGCMVFSGMWQATYETQEESGLSGMLVQVKEVPASGGSTDKVMLTLMFGQMMGDSPESAGIIDIHGAEFDRDGRATITREGNGAVIRIEGTAQHGAAVQAVLRCATMNVMS